MGLNNPAGASLVLPAWLDENTPDPADLDDAVLAAAAADATSKANAVASAAAADATTKANNVLGVAAGPVLRSGRFYYGSIGDTLTATLSDGFYVLYPFLFPNAVTIDRLQIDCSTAGASTVVRLGIYSDSGGFPNTKLGETSNLDTSTTGLKNATVSIAVPAGISWFAVVKAGVQNCALRASAYHTQAIGQVGMDALSASQLDPLNFSLMRSGWDGSSALLTPITGLTQRINSHIPRVGFRVA